MRMWMVNPEMLCRKHLLGEHLECHMFVGTILAGKSLKGYVDNGLVEVDSLVQRHNDLAVEMSKRGTNISQHSKNLILLLLVELI